MKTVEPIRDKRQVTDLVEYYQKRGHTRNFVLIVVALFTALRISDILLLRWDDVYDFAAGRVRARLYLKEKKTGKVKSIKLHTNIVSALQLFAVSAKPGGYLFENPQTGKALSRSQAYRIIRSAAEAVGIPTRVSCHSLRKTFGYLNWIAGKKPEIIMKAYNHSSLAVTSRYLGITQDDIDSLYEDAELMLGAC